MLVNCQPAGDYLGEDFYRAGGMPAVMGELLRAGVMEADELTVSARTVKELYGCSQSSDGRVIRRYADPVRPSGGFLVLDSNIFRSAVFKASVLTDAFRHRYLQDARQPGVFVGRAIVFDGPEDYHKRIDDPALAIDEECILVMRGCGPLGYPGSAEVVNMSPPDYLIRRGIDILPCIGDGRQSGTSASPSILHVTPESATGEGLALVESGDRMRIDLTGLRVDLLIDEQELSQRRARSTAARLNNQTPWQEIYRAYVRPLDEGAGLATEKRYRRIADVEGLPRHSH
jgi:dihydroxy-acid dehydratase